MADVSSCYQYIDHEVIHDEVVSRTASPFLADAIVSLLTELEGRSFGLPQNREASHRLAELVLSIPERVLIRKGYHITRYSDDFRISVTDRAEASEAIEDLDASLRSIGLTLNDAKTIIKSVPEYADFAGAVDQRINEIQGETEVALTEFTYDGDAIPPDQEQVFQEAAIELLGVWARDLQEDRNRYGPEAAVGRQIVARALGALAALNSPRAIDQCKSVLASEPSLTPAVARYLEAVRASSQLEFTTAFDAIVGPGGVFLSPWQSIWLMQTLDSKVELTQTQSEWLKRLLGGRSDSARAYAANRLAIHGLADTTQLVRMFDSALDASRPLLVSAMAIQGGLGKSSKSAVCGEDPIFRWVFDSSGENSS